jgi:methionine synthase II (cobalamin-independent)
MKARIYEAAEIMSQSTTVKRTKEEALNQYVSAKQHVFFVDLETIRLCISPQCGFASHAEGNRITTEVARKKLKLVAEIAEEVWGSN